MTENTPLRYYEDIIYVYENWANNQDDTPSQRALRMWVNESAANSKEFFKILIPKATDYLEKRQGGEDEKVVSFEKRSIAELKEALNEIVDGALAAR